MMRYSVKIKFDDGEWLDFSEATIRKAEEATVIYFTRGGRRISPRIAAFLTKWCTKVTEVTSDEPE